MAETSGIEWTDSTFNPWMGCTKVSPGCDNCYAAVSTPARTLGIGWGPGKPRWRSSASTWRLPLRWNAKPFYQCHACGWRTDTPAVAGTSLTDGLPSCPSCDSLDVRPARRRVFCASLADVFDNEVPTEWRIDLLGLIRATPNLDWLLLTKRIGNVRAMVTRNWLGGDGLHLHGWPSNCWLGATICNQEEADRDIPKLLATPAAVRFLSMEPLLGPVQFRWQPYAHQADGIGCREYLERQGSVNEYEALRKIDWVIAGGESGPSARPMHPDWVRSLRDQCAAAGVPFLFKQWGEWAGAGSDATARLTDPISIPHLAVRVGKKAAGRHLDGQLHNGFPEVR
jgi:protein gp37